MRVCNCAGHANVFSGPNVSRHPDGDSASWKIICFKSIFNGVFEDVVRNGEWKMEISIHYAAAHTTHHPFAAIRNKNDLIVYDIKFICRDILKILSVSVRLRITRIESVKVEGITIMFNTISRNCLFCI